jgi:hypothetical protein
LCLEYDIGNILFYWSDIRIREIDIIKITRMRIIFFDFFVGISHLTILSDYLVSDEFILNCPVSCLVCEPDSPITEVFRLLDHTDSPIDWHLVISESFFEIIVLSHLNWHIDAVGHFFGNELGIDRMDEIIRKKLHRTSLVSSRDCIDKVQKINILRL